MMCLYASASDFNRHIWKIRPQLLLCSTLDMYLFFRAAVGTQVEVVEVAVAVLTAVRGE